VPGVLSLEEKRPWREAHHLYPCSAENKNAGSCTSTAPHFVMTWCLIKHKDCKLWPFRLGYRLVWYVGRDVAGEGAASVVHPEDRGSVFLRNTARCHRTENPESLRNDFAALRCELCEEYFGEDFCLSGRDAASLGEWFPTIRTNVMLSIFGSQELRRPKFHRESRTQRHTPSTLASSVTPL